MQQPQSAHGPPPDAFGRWFEALYARHTAALQFAEVRRAVTALSTLYVQRRERIAQGRALDGRGKRAAFALFYAPLHVLLLRHIVAAVGCPKGGTVLDLGCGTGAAGAAWGLHGAARLRGIDSSRWAVGEARWNWQQLGLTGQASCGDVAAAALPALGHNDGAVAAYVVNELDTNARQALLGRLLAAHRRGVAVLIVEPIAQSVVPWWTEWQTAFEACGGAAAVWRLPVRLPPKLALLDKAAGLRHSQLKGRSLYLPPAAP
jgi:predicted nicotinamide N-methyase